MSRSHLEEQSISEWALIATSGIEVRPRWFEASQLSDPNDTLNVSTTLRFPRSAAGYLLRLASDTSFKFHLSTNRVPQSPPTTINQPTLSNDGFLEIRFSCTITSAWLCAYTEQLVYGKPLTLPLSLVHSPFFHLAESLSYQWDIGILSVVQLDHQSRRGKLPCQPIVTIRG